MASFRIVVFHCAVPGRAGVSGDLAGPAQIDLLYRSAKATNPNIELTVLTNEETDLPALSFPFERVNGTVDVSRIMFERTRMQREYVSNAPPAAPMAFLDSDILLCKDLAPLFKQDFDIGLTWRRSASMPINGGVIFANNRRPQAIISFFEQLEGVYRDRHADRSDWYGDQFALTEVAGIPSDPGFETGPYEAGGVRYLLLPRETYNYTPAGPLPLLRGPGDAHLIHFKGRARRYMQPFWTYWIGPRHDAGLRRPLALLWTSLKFRLSKRSYHRVTSRPPNRFNLDGQDNPTWHERAEIALDLVAKVAGEPGSRLLDIGCGDGKLGVKLGERELGIEYAGYDLHPQGPDVRALDISTQEIPEKADVVVSLGVLEYLSEPEVALQRFARCAPSLVVSLSPRDLHKRLVRGLNWRSYLTTSEFEKKLTGAGYRILESRITPDQRSRVWLASLGKDRAGD